LRLVVLGSGCRVSGGLDCECCMLEIGGRQRSARVGHIFGAGCRDGASDFIVVGVVRPAFDCQGRCHSFTVEVMKNVMLS